MLWKWKSIQSHYRTRGLEYIIASNEIESLHKKEPLNKELQQVSQLMNQGLKELKEEYTRTTTYIKEGGNQTVYMNNIVLLALLWKTLTNHLLGMDEESHCQIPKRYDLLHKSANELTKLKKIIDTYEKTN